MNLLPYEQDEQLDMDDHDEQEDVDAEQQEQDDLARAIQMSLMAAETEVLCALFSLYIINH